MINLTKYIDKVLEDYPHLSDDIGDVFHRAKQNHEMDLENRPSDVYQLICDIEKIISHDQE